MEPFQEMTDEELDKRYNALIYDQDTTDAERRAHTAELKLVVAELRRRGKLRDNKPPTPKERTEEEATREWMDVHPEVVEELRRKHGLQPSDSES